MTAPAVVTVPRAALEHLLTVLELTEFDDWTDEDNNAWEQVCRATGHQKVGA